MAKNNKGGFTPPKGNPSGNGRDNQGIKSAFGGVDPETEREIKDQYTTGEDEEPADNVHVLHHNRNVNKGEDTNKPNQQLDL